MKLVVEEKVGDIQVFGDSSLVVNWMNGRDQLPSLHLQGIGKLLKKLEGVFNSLRICHIFIEQNEWGNVLSKEGLNIAADIMIFTIFKW